MKNAISIARFYLSEALRIQEIAQVEPNLMEAQKLLDWIQDHKLTQFPTSLIYQHGPNTIRSSGKAKTTLTILKKHGWVQGPEEGEWKGTKCKEIWSRTE